MNQKVLTISVAALSILSVGFGPIQNKNYEPSFSALPSKTLRIAVIDTGLNLKAFNQHIKLCDDGHKDFTGTGIIDNHGHGTHISGLIEQNASGIDYCQIIIKYYDPAAKTNNLENTIKAFKLAVDLNVDVINYSGGGTSESVLEKAIIMKALNKGIVIVAAAGNERCNMDSEACQYYPAMYDERIIVVNNISQDRVIAESSNSGTVVDVSEIGVNVESFCKDGPHITCKMTGTSQSTAIHSGKVLRRIDANRKSLTIDRILILSRTA